MTDLVLHGLPPSSYVRSARMIAAAKGVPYTLAPVDFRSSDYRQLHPFGRMPALTHGDVHLFEMLAIGVYIDMAFDGPPLQPADAAGRGVMMQWISAINDYGYTQLVRNCIAERVIKPWRGLAPDEDKIATALPLITEFVDAVERGLEGPYLAGDQMTLADLILAPIMVYFADTPEGRALLPARGRLVDWSKRMESAPDFAAINALN